MSEFKGRSLAFVRVLVHDTFGEFSAPSAASWCRANRDRLERGEPAPPGAIMFWYGNRFGYCALRVGKDQIIDSEYGCMKLDAPEVLWGYVYAGWVKP